MLWIQREVEKVDAREADRVKELKELYEKKVGDKDLEIARLRDSIHKMTEEGSRQQSEMFKRSEENNSLKS